MNTCCIRYILLIVSLVCLHKVNAQKGNSCGTGEMMNHTEASKPLLRMKKLQTEDIIYNSILNRRNFKTTDDATYTIPVVVHVVHNNGAENISDEQVKQGIQHLNESFSNSGVYANQNGVVTGIQFCLANQDESGNVTTGITRSLSPLTEMLMPSQDLLLKNISRWDPKKYLNIWIVKEITSESHGTGVAGYAFFPSTHGMPEDGVVCEALYFGTTSDNSKILIHELGHYFGLYHTFEGGCTNNNCLTDGDRVCDTPPDASSNPMVCSLDMNSCTNDEDDHSTNNPYRPVSMGGLGDQKDLTNNYMDYANDICRVLFTNGQKERMTTALTSARASLLSSGACVDLCPNPITVSYTPDDTTVVMGASVNFITTSTNVNNYQWYVNGTKVSESINLTYSFNQMGSYTIKLVAKNSDMACEQSLSTKVIVKCGAKAAFTGPTRSKPGESVTFTNTSTGTNTYQWLIDGIPTATTTELVHSFSAGGYMVRLVAYNGQCYDTSRAHYIKVSSCAVGNESNTWYFGMLTGITFSGDSVVPFTIPLNMTTLPLLSTEACLSMSDANGNILFIANPNYVFNRNRTQMPNGSGLLGHSSATQMAAVMNPVNPNIYYLFTLDGYGNPNGLRYSVIDMTLDGGLGDVVASSKNILMLTPVTEKITTVKHANGIDTWVIVHAMDSDAFYAYLVTASGVNTTPVITHIGSVHPMAGIGLGQLKASPDGCKLALAMHTESTIELFNFNNNTGVISSPLSITDNTYKEAYGVEFSPDGSKLYIVTEGPHTIYQFDLLKPTVAEIASSVVVIGVTDGNSRLGSLQTGPDGKIYVARSGQNFLGVINNPNAKGALCDFDMKGVNLGTGICNAGLPGFMSSSLYNPEPTITGPDTVCINSKDVKYKISHSSCASDISTWILKGNGNITSSNDTIAIIDFTEAGIDTLIVNRISSCGPTSDTMLIVIKQSSFDIKDTMQCSSSPVVLNAGPGYLNYLWQDNSTSETFSANGTGKYWVTVTSKEGCTMTDTIRITKPSLPDVNLGNDISICPGKIVTLNAGSGFTTYKWQDYTEEQSLTAYLPGKYWITVTNACKQEDSDTIYIKSAGYLSVDIGDDIGLCSGDSVVLNGTSGYKDYVWQNGSQESSLTVNSQGLYWLLVTDYQGCYGIDSVKVIAKTDCCSTIEIPNLITPNNDQLNDYFKVGCLGSGGWTLEIYNRWGKLIYNDKDYKNDWSGENATDGIYFYKLIREESLYSGWVQLTR